jgi:hypothetical protein
MVELFINLIFFFEKQLKSPIKGRNYKIYLVLKNILVFTKQIIRITRDNKCFNNFRKMLNFEYNKRI